MLEQYKAEKMEKVMAVCGKVWAPEFPVNRVYNHPRCAVCFPNEGMRYAIAK